jgi:uncharacterized membrane protein YbhN (UPF0104 family)
MICTWGLLVLHYYLMLLAFEPLGDWTWAAFGIGIVGLGVAVPSAPGSVGIVEGLIVSVFPLVFGISPSVALAYSLVLHAIYLVITSSLGLLGLLINGESLLEIYREIRAFSGRVRLKGKEINS